MWPDIVGAKLGTNDEVYMRLPASILLSALALAFASSSGPAANAQTSPDARVADIVAAGKLRAGVGVVDRHWAVKNQQSGELEGVAMDLARALAMRIGVELALVPYPSPPRVLDNIASNAWDVAFLGSDPSSASIVDFSRPYIQIEASFLVPTASLIRNLTEIDQSTVRVAVARQSAEQIFLSEILMGAELREVETISAGFDLLRAGNADALAAPSPTLFQLSARADGFRVLENPFHMTFGAMAVPKGYIERLAYVEEFLAEAKRSGLLQNSLERAKVEGVKVAPANVQNR
jgi:polar amino acid transport system substrate-binding protein